MTIATSIRTACLALAGSTLAIAAHAQSITPDSVTQTIAVGESFTINKSITLGAGGATTVDVFFLADNTGSMGGTISRAEAGASAILDALPDTYRFGVGRYLGDPSEPGVTPATAYVQNTALTFDQTAVQTGINSWFASGGGDGPEANYFALQQVADTAGWRPEAQRLVVWFGDATSHTETTTQAQAISALQAADARVIAFNNTSAGAGIDGRYFTEPVGTRQATEIIAATGGSLTNSFGSISAQGFIDAVTAQISAATSTLDLVFGSTFAGTGLDISFTCTDLLGCDDVEAGTSRTFDVTITGLTEGTYNFNVFAQGIDAFETDTITVVGATAPVPEPSTYALMLAGLTAVGRIVRRKSRRDPA